MTVPESFPLLHAIRIKGLATDPVLASMVGLSEDDLAAHLAPVIEAQLVVRREGRMSGSMLTPAGRSAHAEMMASAAPTGANKDAAETFYDAFLPINGTFKRVCNAWQMRDESTPNDHTDPEYDASVVADLAAVHADVVAALVPLGENIVRMSRYRPRLTAALDRVRGGDRAAFARPMYDSYHDIWMELHQDLLMVCGRERGEHDEG